MNSRFIRTVIVTLALGIAACRAELTWLTDYDTALQQARSEGKLVLIDFTGSDWCGWCMKLNKEILSTPEFARYAGEKLILVELDFPKNKPQSPRVVSQNQNLQQRFRILPHRSGRVAEHHHERQHHAGSGERRERCHGELGGSDQRQRQ